MEVLVSLAREQGVQEPGGERVAVLELPLAVVAVAGLQVVPVFLRLALAQSHHHQALRQQC
mgnify:CR=1 FL=1